MKSFDRTRPAVGAMAWVWLKGTGAGNRARQAAGSIWAAACRSTACSGEVGDMACQIDAARLLVYHAAYQRDSGVERFTRESALQKCMRLISPWLRRPKHCKSLAAGDTWGSIRMSVYGDARRYNCDGSNEILKLVIARSFTFIILTEEIKG